MDLSLHQDISIQYFIFSHRRNEVTRRGIVLQRFSRGFLIRNRIRNNRRNNETMSFCINPYDVVLNLRDKDDRNVYLDGCKGLKDDGLFEGNKEK